MKPLATSVMIALVAVVSPANFAAEAKPAAPVAKEDAAKAPLAGSFAGTWQAANGDANGKLKIAFKADGDKWSAEASFTYQGAEVPTKLKSVKVTGAKVELVFEYTVDTTNSGSTLLGELKGDKVEGSYETFDGGRGTWSVTRA